MSNVKNNDVRFEMFKYDFNYDEKKVIKSIKSKLLAYDRFESRLLELNDPDIVKSYKRKEYLNRFLNSGIRRRIQNKKYLGLDFYVASKKADCSYGDYIKRFIESYSREELAEAFAVTFVTTMGIEKVLDFSVEELNIKMNDYFYFFSNSWIYTVWKGQQKEFLAFKLLKQYVPSGYSVSHSAPWQDKKFKVDFLIVENGTEKIVGGVSVKNISFKRGLEKGSFYATSGASFEFDGLKDFTEKYDAVSDILYIDDRDSYGNSSRVIKIVDKIFGINASIDDNFSKIVW